VKISVYGLGYVGCVSAACLAQSGHEIVGVDINPQKSKLLTAGLSPVAEPGLQELVTEVVRLGTLKVANNNSALDGTDASLICVGTPSNGNGSLKLDYVESVCREIGAALGRKTTYHVVIVRSTVLPGTVEERLIPLLEQSSGKRVGEGFGVCMNPEFLREGTAIKDYTHPSLVVIGENDEKSGDLVSQLYHSVEAPTVRTSIRTAEMVKYASNAFHALKITFANEMGNLCKALGLDGQEVMEIFCKDRRLNISPSYLSPGFAFGGSCLPKDVRALLYRAKQLDVDCSVLSAILPSNQKQVELGIRLVENAGVKKVGILGLSFKADTDDLRESPAVILAETLLGRGYRVKIFDERVQLSQLLGSNKSFLERELPHIASLMCSSVEDLASQSEVVIITNQSKSFEKISGSLNGTQKLIDLVGLAKNCIPSTRYEGMCW
jgi:GDP-mannose 6-dehydrogenase